MLMVGWALMVVAVDSSRAVLMLINRKHETMAGNPQQTAVWCSQRLVAAHHRSSLPCSDYLLSIPCRNLQIVLSK